jgi:hypothetical protein
MANLQNTITFRTGKFNFEFVLDKTTNVYDETHHIYDIYINGGLSRNKLTVRFPIKRDTTAFVVTSNFSLVSSLDVSSNTIWNSDFAHTQNEEFPFPKRKLFEITEYCNTQYC